MRDLHAACSVLGIPPGASEEQAREAYRDLAKVWHPDRHESDPRLRAKAEEKLKQINAAYETLRAAGFPSFTSLPEPPSVPHQASSSPRSPPPPPTPSPPSAPAPSQGQCPAVAPPASTAASVVGRVFGVVVALAVSFGVRQSCKTGDSSRSSSQYSSGYTPSYSSDPSAEPSAQAIEREVPLRTLWRSNPNRAAELQAFKVAALASLRADIPSIQGAAITEETLDFAEHIVLDITATMEGMSVAGQIDAFITNEGTTYIMALADPKSAKSPASAFATTLLLLPPQLAAHTTDAPKSFIALPPDWERQSDEVPNDGVMYLRVAGKEVGLILVYRLGRPELLAMLKSAGSNVSAARPDVPASQASATVAPTNGSGGETGKSPSTRASARKRASATQDRSQANVQPEPTAIPTEPEDPERPTFGVGSSAAEVRAAQGSPDRVVQRSISTEIWQYGGSTVTMTRGVVEEYSNLARNLRLK